MLETVLGKADDQIAETAHRASRAASAMNEALEDGIGVAKRAVKHGCDAAEELMEDTELRIKRHPVETVIGAFALGTLIGVLIGRFALRK
jgi:ElaB/YqjD/DUF883 family membrane-anchored ribosome-binding protein